MSDVKWVLNGAGKLNYEAFVRRAPVGDEIQIDVYSSGLNFADAMMLKGLYPDAPAYPFVPGYEVSGVISAVGPKVTRFRPGDQVMGGVYFGGYSSCVNVSERQCVKIPPTLNVMTGASVVVSFLTAWLALVEYARIREGDRIVVDCASGALGSMMALLARHSGAHLSGLTSSEHKKEGILKLYDEAMTHAEFAASAGKFDIIIQSRGGPSFHHMLKRLRPGGRIVALGVSELVAQAGPIHRVRATLRTLWGLRPIFPATLMNENIGIFGLNVLRLFESFEILENGLAKLEEFAPQIPIAATFESVDLEVAFRQILSKQLVGKVLLQWRPHVS